MRAANLIVILSGVEGPVNNTLLYDANTAARQAGDETWQPDPDAIPSRHFERSREILTPGYRTILMPPPRPNISTRKASRWR